MACGWAGQGSQGLRLWGACGARGWLRAALLRHCTHLTHMQCNSNAPRDRPPLQAPTPTTCMGEPARRAMPLTQPRLRGREPEAKQG